MPKPTPKSLRPELACASMLLGILAIDIAANYRLLLGVDHEDRVLKTSKIYFVSAAGAGGPLMFLVPPLIVWAWAALMWRVVFERKGADFVQMLLFGASIYYFLTEVVPLENSIQNLSSKSLHDTLLKIFWGHIILTLTVAASIVLSFIARPPPSRTRLEVIPSSIWLGMILFILNFYVRLIIDEHFPTVALDAIAHLLTETFLLNFLAPGLIGISFIVAFGRLFTSGRGLRDVVFLVLTALQAVLFLSIYQRLDMAAGDKKYPVSAHKANGGLFAASGLLAIFSILLQWGCGGAKKVKSA